MYLLGNGDIMEVGVMSIDGKPQLFKEYWIWPDTTSATFIVMETVEAEGDSAGKGILVLINDYCQAVLQTKSDFWMERWQKREEHGWSKDDKSNTSSADELLPGQWAVLEARAKGDSVKLSGREWKVTESSTA
jgi:hypothetical protein